MFTLCACDNHDFTFDEEKQTFYVYDMLRFYIELDGEKELFYSYDIELKEKVDEFNSRRLTKENESRLLVNMEASIELEDDIYRSLGILQNCRIISAQEAMKHLSNIKLGIEMDYIKDISLEKVINLMTGMKPIMELMSPITSDGDIKRADFLREEFTLANRNKK